MTTLRGSQKTWQKNWNFTMAQSEALHALLEMALAPIECGALVLPEGKTLHLKTSSAADIATLPQAALLCDQYLKLRDRDVVIMNDPFSGGTTLSDLTLVAGACFENMTSPAEILLTVRLKLPARLPEGPKIDDEGVRIPPTPLASGGRLNEDLLRAIAGHPLAPKNLVLEVQNAHALIERVIASLKNLGRDPGSEFKKTHFKRYLSDSSLAFQGLMSRLPLGATTVMTQISPSGETLKLHLEISENHLAFDFAGTENSTVIGLTETATLGACIASTAAALNQNLPMNSGVFEHFQVSTPAKTLLSARAPQGMFRGVQFGIAAIGSLINDAFAKLKPVSFQAAAGCGADGFFQIMFDDGRLLIAHLPPGSGAHKDLAGIDAHALWGTHRISGAESNASVEEIERNFPVNFVYSGIRSNSGGKGKKRGGHGVLWSLRLEKPAQARWMLGAMTERFEGKESGRAGSSATVEVIRAASDDATAVPEEFTSSDGSVALQAGDEIRLATSGGGGFGDAD